MLKDAANEQNYESDILAMVKVAKNKTRVIRMEACSIYRKFSSRLPK